MTETRDMSSAPTGLFGVTKRSLEAPRESQLTSFVDPVDVSNAFSLANWNVSKEIQLLVSIANDENVKAATRLAAARQLRKLAIEALILSGSIRKVTAVGEGPGGEKLTVTAAHVRDALLDAEQGLTTFQPTNPVKELPDGRKETSDPVVIHKPPVPIDPKTGAEIVNPPRSGPGQDSDNASPSEASTELISEGNSFRDPWTSAPLGGDVDSEQLGDPPRGPVEAAVRLSGQDLGHLE